MADLIEELQASINDLRTKRDNQEQAIAQLNGMINPIRSPQQPQRQQISGEQNDTQRLLSMQEKINKIYFSTPEGADGLATYNAGFSQWMIKSGNAEKVAVQMRKFRDQFEAANKNYKEHRLAMDDAALMNFYSKAEKVEQMMAAEQQISGPVSEETVHEPEKRAPRRKRQDTAADAYPETNEGMQT